MQRRELHRDAVAGEGVAADGLGADGPDRLAIGLQVDGCVGRCARAFAQHVKRIAEGAVSPAVGTAQRFADIAPEDKGLAHKLHGVGHGRADRRLAQAGGEAPHGRSARRRLGHRLGDDQSERGAVDQHGVGGAQVCAPVAQRQLVADQGVGRAWIGYAQIGLGEAEQRRPLVAGQAVLLQEAVDPAGPAGRAQRRQQAAGFGADARAFVGGQASVGGEVAQRLRFGASVKGRDGPPRVCQGRLGQGSVGLRSGRHGGGNRIVSAATQFRRGGRPRFADPLERCR